MDIQLGDVGHIIQLSVAPVFLLAGVGTNLMVLTNRLARIIDRSRVLEERLDSNNTAHPQDQHEIDVLYRRGHLINRAITLSTSCALFICIVIAALFIGDALNIALNRLIGTLFVLAMFALIGSFIYFLREIFIATRTLTLRRVFPPK
ncbi:MAG: DUF2721 domain-containing protein [Burkholderiaceae bacterium]